MAKRKIINIDENRCNGCGDCLPNCPEGALQIIDGKARLISDLFCDGLGACIGHCPQEAITTVEREAQGYDEKRVMENIIKQGPNVIKAHLSHLKEHSQNDYLKEAIDYLKKNNIKVPVDYGQKHKDLTGCPGSRMMDLTGPRDSIASDGKVSDKKDKSSNTPSQLRQWPVQIMLVGTSAPYLKGADLLIAADCVPFAYADFHKDLLKGKVLLVGCPKLDDLALYKEKITQILKVNSIRSITYAHMEVPCCSGLINIIRSAISASGEDIPFEDVTIGIKGERIQ